MQKKILLIAVYFTFTGACVNAQNKKHIPPPPPPAPAAPIENLIAPPPPEPPMPPAPPLPPVELIDFVSPVIVNNNGYDISIKKINGNGIIFLEKDACKTKDQTINLECKQEILRKEIWAVAATTARSANTR